MAGHESHSSLSANAAAKLIAIRSGSPPKQATHERVRVCVFLLDREYGEERLYKAKDKKERRVTCKITSKKSYRCFRLFGGQFDSLLSYFPRPGDRIFGKVLL